MRYIFLFLTFIGTSIFANIGMSKAECDKKYGDSVHYPDGDGFSYTYNKLTVIAFFENDKCSQIIYRSTKKFTNGKFKSLVKENCKEKYKLTLDAKEEKSKHYQSKNFYIDFKEKEIVITFDPK